MRFKRSLLLCVLSMCLLFGGALRAGDFSHDARLMGYLEELEARGSVPYQLGYVLEDLVRIELEKLYPPAEYEITGGLEMSNAEGYALGEIDILVLRRSDGRAVLVGEAKMWRNLAAGLKKAQSQLDRLKRVMDEGEVASMMYIPEPGRVFTLKQFSGPVKYETFGSRGAVAVGFDHEIDVTPEEGRWLHKQLMERHFQRQGYAGNEQLTKYVDFVKMLKWPSNSPKLTFIACVILDIQQQYPYDQYNYYQDVHYIDAEGTDLGHVKLVFRHRDACRIVLVSNVVFGWNNLKNAATVYNRYLCEFQSALTDERIVLLEAEHPRGATLEVSEFDGLVRYESYGPKGARKAGFSKELNLTEDQVYYIRYAASGRL